MATKKILTLQPLQESDQMCASKNYAKFCRLCKLPYLNIDNLLVPLWCIAGAKGCRHMYG